LGKDEMEKRFDEYITKQRDETPYSGDWICESRGYEHNDATMGSCFNGNGDPEIWNYSPHFNGFPCNEPNGCWIGRPDIFNDKYEIIDFSTKKRSNKEVWEESVLPQLNAWGVIDDFKDDYKQGMWFDSAEFLMMNYFVEAGDQAGYEVAFGAVRNYNNSVQIGYVHSEATTWVARRFRQNDGHNCIPCQQLVGQGWGCFEKEDGTGWHVAIDGDFKHVTDRPAYCLGAHPVGLNEQNIEDVRNALKWNSFNKLLQN